VVIDEAVVEADVVVKAVVEEAAAVPVAAVESNAEVAEAVVDAAVVADMASPVPGVPEIPAIAPTPISRSPKRVYIRRLDSRAVNPVVAGIPVSPIARSPEISYPGASGCA
jgi:hypothetical protein